MITFSHVLRWAAACHRVGRRAYKVAASAGNACEIHKRADPAYWRVEGSAGQTTDAARSDRLELQPTWPGRAVAVPEAVGICWGWTIEAAESLCSVDGDPDALSGLESLVDASLVRQLEEVDGEPQFSMLQTVSDYATELLEGSGEAGELRRRHAGYYLELVTQAEPKLRGPEQVQWLDRLESEHSNLRAALGWSLAGGNTRSGLRMCAALWRFWYIRGHLMEGVKWLEMALVSDTGVDASSRADVLTGLAAIAMDRADHHRAVQLFEECLSLRRAGGDRSAIARALNNLAIASNFCGDRDRALALWDEALPLERTSGDKVGLATTLVNLGVALKAHGDTSRAKHLLEESLELFRELGDTRDIAITLLNLADPALAPGDVEGSARRYRESLQLFSQAGDEVGKILSVEGLGAAAGARGDVQLAARLFGAAAARREAIGAVPAEEDLRAHNDLVKSIRRNSSKRVWEQAWEQGCATSFEEVVSYALTGT